MSIETRQYEMPQPEKWLSEHEPWTTLAIVVAAILVTALVWVLT